MNTKLLSLSVIGLSLATTGCKLKDKLTDALDGENDSYCETVCDWATACVCTWSPSWEMYLPHLIQGGAEGTRSRHIEISEDSLAAIKALRVCVRFLGRVLSNPHTCTISA